MTGLEETSVKTVIGKYLLYNVQHVSALIMGHNQVNVRIFHQITIAHNTLLRNWLISQHQRMFKWLKDDTTKFKK